MTAHELAKALLAGPDLPLVTCDQEYGCCILDPPFREITKEEAIYSCSWGEEAKQELRQSERYLCL